MKNLPDEARDSRRRTRRRPAPAPALVRRTAALRQAHRRHALARTGRRARGAARIAGRRAGRGADDPRGTARRLRSARRGGRRGRLLRLDRFHQRERRRLFHAAADGGRRRHQGSQRREARGHRSGDGRSPRAARTESRPRAGRVARRSDRAVAARDCGELNGKRFLLPRADIAREVLPDELRKSGAR